MIEYINSSKVLKVTIGGPHPGAKNDKSDDDSASGIQPPAVTTDQGSKETKSINDQVVAMVACKNVGSVVLSNCPAVQEQTQLASYEPQRDAQYVH